MHVLLLYLLHMLTIKYIWKIIQYSLALHELIFVTSYICEFVRVWVVCVCVNACVVLHT